MSEFSGKLEEIEEVSIDRFDGDNINSTAFFLSHCHSDHMEGLNSKELRDALLKRDDVYLYCSEISSCILINDPNYLFLKERIKPLKTNQTYILPVPSYNSARKDLCVTLIPAGHCPGSVMFLFELPAGNILFTGDFRVTMNDVKTLKHLHHSDGTLKVINSLYLDATFFDDLYPSFPSREESLQKVCELIKEWLTADDSNEILLDTSARYGCEHIFVGISDVFGMKIHVYDGIFLKYRNVRTIGSAITSNSDETRIHACGRKCCRRRDSKFKTIRLSCMWFQREFAAKEEIFQICPSYTRVCYACHNSHSELVAFLRYLSPKRVSVFAPPKGKSIHEAEKEICDLLKKKKERIEEREDDVDKLWKKRRLFDVKQLQSLINVSPLQLTEEWSLTEDRASVSVGNQSQSLETSQQDSGEMLSKDSEGSFSLLPQCCPAIEPLTTSQGEKEIEVIILSSDDSSEIITVE